MRVRLTTIFDAPPDRVWAELRKSALLDHVAAPLLKFKPIDPPAKPAEWGSGRYLVGLWFLGLLPLGRQWIVTSFEADPDRPDHYSLRDNGSGQLVKRWDHWIFLEPTDDGRTRYTDRVDIGAGFLTPGIWLFAQVFYRHRQARWRALIARDFAY